VDDKIAQIEDALLESTAAIVSLLAAVERLAGHLPLPDEDRAAVNSALLEAGRRLKKLLEIVEKLVD
jgi:hypothetical protein